MRDLYILSEDGRTPKVAEVMEWGKWMSSADRRVELTELPGHPDISVSTVFLGLDHRFGDGPPLLWETMVFGGPLDRECDRYASYEDAVAGHRAMVELVETRLLKE